MYFDINKHLVHFVIERKFKQNGYVGNVNTLVRACAVISEENIADVRSRAQ